MTGKMTKGDRENLLKLARQREKVMKAQARERSAMLLAEFEAQSAKIHNFNDDAVWAAATKAAQEACAQAQEIIAERCRALGIPDEFAPGIHFGWYGRGEQAVAQRQAELRRVAKRKIEAMETEAITKIERMSLEVQTQITINGLETDGAREFLDQMPDLLALMPPLEIGEMQSLLAPKPRDEHRSLEWQR